MILCPQWPSTWCGINQLKSPQRRLHSASSFIWHAGGTLSLSEMLIRHTTLMWNITTGRKVQIKKIYFGNQVIKTLNSTSVSCILIVWIALFKWPLHVYVYIRTLTFKYPTAEWLLWHMLQRLFPKPHHEHRSRLSSSPTLNSKLKINCFFLSLNSLTAKPKHDLHCDHTLYWHHLHVLRRT